MPRGGGVDEVSVCEVFRMIGNYFLNICGVVSRGASRQMRGDGEDEVSRGGGDIVSEVSSIGGYRTRSTPRRSDGNRDHEEGEH